MLGTCFEVFEKGQYVATYNIAMLNIPEYCNNMFSWLKYRDIIISSGLSWFPTASPPLLHDGGNQSRASFDLGDWIKLTYGDKAAHSLWKWSILTDKMYKIELQQNGLMHWWCPGMLVISALTYCQTHCCLFQQSFVKQSLWSSLHPSKLHACVCVCVSGATWVRGTRDRNVSGAEKHVKR